MGSSFKAFCRNLRGTFPVELNGKTREFSLEEMIKIREENDGLGEIDLFAEYVEVDLSPVEEYLKDVNMDLKGLQKGLKKWL